MIAPPTRAFVLAAGFGTRMLPITRDLPKPMLPVWGIPAIERTFRMLRRWGVRDVLVNLHHRPDEIRRHVATRRPDGLSITFSHERDILGTGGALAHARNWVEAGPFWMINADVVCDLDPKPIARSFRPDRTIASVWLHPTRGPRTVETRRGCVVHWRSRNAATFCGLQLLDPRILEYIPPRGESSIITAYERAAADGWKVAGVAVPGAFWADIGTPAQYLEAHRELRAVRVFRSVDPTARVARGAIVRNSVVMAGARIRSGARVENAVIGRGAVVRGDVRYIAMPAERALTAPETRAVRALGWRAQETTALPLGPRGSARSFTRLQRGRDSVMLVHYNPDRFENTLYAGHARFLARLGVPVPAVRVDRPRDCITILDDAGDESLQSLVPRAGRDEVARRYRRVLDAMLVFHERGVVAARRAKWTLVPAFRERLYRWEHDYFAEHFLAKRMGLSESGIRALKRDLWRIAQRLLDAPAALVHRDLQSSNVLLRGDAIVLIDFQGMRYGPAAYDLASLLCDPYVSLPDGLRDELLAHYLARSAHADAVRAGFWPAAVQRLGQALGAYARLGSDPDTRAFAAHIPPALRMLRLALRRVYGARRVPPAWRPLFAASTRT